jgi:hypothetical protein
MKQVSTREWIGFSTEDVFRAGIRTENWPGVNGLVVEADNDVVALGGLIRAKLSIPGIRLGLDCRVTEFEPNQRVRIEGRSKLARAVLHFELNPDEYSTGTHVDYTFGIEPKSLFARAAAPVVEAFVVKAVPEFAAGYRRNVTEYLSLETT